MHRIATSTIASARQIRRVGWGVAVCLLCAVASSGPLINRVYTEKARYVPGEPCAITAEMQNLTSDSWQGKVILRIWHRNVLVHEAVRECSLTASSDFVPVTFSWIPPLLDYRGYSVAIQADHDVSVTAIDVSSDWTRFPRYGFMTEFYSGQSLEESQEYIARLSEDFHLNAIQYYDWMYRHELVIRRPRPGVISDPWEDWRGEAISFSVLQDLVGECHDRNVAAMPYFMIYGGRENYQASGVSSDWGVYSDVQQVNQHYHPLKPEEGINLFVFDPANIHWQGHLSTQIVDAIETVGFDGIHLDQLGYIDPIFDSDGGPLNFEDGWRFRQMIDRARSELDILSGQSVPPLGQLAVTFNMVGGNIDGWGMADVVSNADQDFLYSEVWSNESYQGICDFVKWARSSSGDKALVLAAYMNYYDETLTELNEASVRLATAVFSIAGAHHLALGDGDRMLSHEFFPSNRLEMTPELKRAMKSYYSFLTAHENLLFEPGLISGGGAGQWFELAGVTTSGIPDANTVWIQHRRSEQHDVIHLVNLLTNDDQWRNAALVPPLLTEVDMVCRLGDGVEVRNIQFASPDVEDGTHLDLAYTTGTDEIGDFVQFRLPSLHYWDTIIIERDVSYSENRRYEAEEGNKSNVTVDSDVSGYSGIGYVDGFIGASDEAVGFTICVPEDGVYDLTFRYANGARISASRSIHVDGEHVADLVFPALQNWSLWSDAVQSVYLTAGLHQVICGFGGSMSIFLDYLELPPVTNGLRGQYFNSLHVADLEMTRVDEVIDFDWGGGSPAAGMDNDGYLVRWSGTVTPLVSGQYTFSVTSDDGARLFVNDQLLVDAWVDQPSTTNSGSIMLSGGELYGITLVYYEKTGGASIQLKWTVPGLSEELIPAHVLHPDCGSLDNQSPSVPMNVVSGSVTESTVELTWEESVDDLAMAGYAVYRNGALIADVFSTTWADTSVVAGSFYEYTVIARDFFGNESAESASCLVSTPGDPPFGDYDGNGIIDSIDVEYFSECMCGPGVYPMPPSPTDSVRCLQVFDADRDSDVDLSDFAELQVVYP